MSAKVLAKVSMDVEQYLRTSFDGADCEYLDGEVVERHMGELPHGDLQANLTRLLWPLRSQLGIRVVTEIYIQIHPRRYRVADIAAWRDDNIGTGIPTVPEWVWVVDPAEKTALCYSQKDPRGAVCEVLRTENPSIEISLDRAFDLNA
jgi:hypothetical protein